MLKKEEITEELEFKDIFDFIIMYLIYWIITGISFFLFVKSIVPISFNQLPTLIFINCLSWVVGYISFLTPGGLGVREATMSFFLSFYFPLPLAILISLLERVLETFWEVLIIGIVYLIDKKIVVFNFLKVKNRNVYS